MFNLLIFIAFLSREQPPSGGCVLKGGAKALTNINVTAATFGWLCVESLVCQALFVIKVAATFGWLCVESFTNRETGEVKEAATFGWLCVESLPERTFKRHRARQPPSGGCVLKATVDAAGIATTIAATFGWLCVERFLLLINSTVFNAATFGWLCVESQNLKNLYHHLYKQPPSGGCVLKGQTNV